MFAVNALEWFLWFMDIVKNGFNAVKRYPLPTFKKLTVLTVTIYTAQQSVVR
jgi:hypothetical protein